MSDGAVAVAAAGISATVSPLGAELQTVRDAEGRDLLWDGDPAWWTGRAPLLFPIVGALNGDRYRLDGRIYGLPKHGFARRRRFALLERAEDRCVFRLEADADTLEAYPFRFRLDVAVTAAGATLTVAATVSNLDAREMPASFGYHPALRWPLPGGGARGDHRIVFATEEPEDLLSIDAAGLVLPQRRPSPLEGGRVLPLRDALFTEDALIWSPVRSRSCRLEGDGRAVEVGFGDAPLLGVWTKPGAPYVCVEPWWGLADPAGFDGELRDKPHSWTLPPGGARTLEMTLTAG